MAALAILGLALFILLDSHYTTLRLHDAMTEEVTLRQFTERVASMAEVEVMAGSLSGDGDFGERYPDYSWSFEATEAGEDEMVLLFDVSVTIDGPDDSRTLRFYFYDTGIDEDVRRP